jgi:excisionase family DNA binding protein
MDYLTTAEAAAKWGVSLRQVQRLLAANRIPGGRQYGHGYLVPADAEKPGDPRLAKKAQPQKPLLADLADLVAATIQPMPRGNPAKVLDGMNDRQRLQQESVLAYLKGDFERVKDCYLKTKGDEAARLCISSVTIAAAISTGDYPLYSEVEAWLKGMAGQYGDPDITVFTELCLANAAVSAVALDMVPEWLKTGDFAGILTQAKPDALYKRAKYFQCLGKYEPMLAVALTALAVYDTGQGVTFHGLYFRAACAMAWCGLGDLDEAKRRLLDALRIAMPHGFITPFAESATVFGGLLEQCLKQEFPEYCDIATEQWNGSFKNWISFHNQFTKANITQILPLRDYQIARLFTQGFTYRQIAEQFNISAGSVSNAMQRIYQRLFISGNNRKNQLSKYVL